MAKKKLKYRSDALAVAHNTAAARSPNMSAAPSRAPRQARGDRLGPRRLRRWTRQSGIRGSLTAASLAIMVRSAHPYPPGGAKKVL